MPGHTNAALAAYPQFACTDGPFTVLPGGVWPITDIYCAGKEETFDFLQNILSEIIDLFPSKYIHIGGDEANKKEWEVCLDCQKRIHDEGLKDEHELQSYFITRIEKFLNQQGRQLIGWDEILEGGLAPNAAVMSWRGVNGGIAAAKSGHPVVMSPTSHCYFDYYQGKPELEPTAFGGFLPLEKVYSFEPVPSELNEDEAKFVLGVQANLWTEHVSTPEHADYMTFPRLCALAEVAWTPANKRNFDFFKGKLIKHLSYLKQNNIGFAKSFSNVDLNTSKVADKKEFLVELSNTIGFGEIRYTLDGNEPQKNSLLYTSPFTLDQTTIIKAATFSINDRYSEISAEKVWIHKSIAADIHFRTEFSEKYTGGGKDALNNGLRGSANLSDGRWQGYSNDNCSVTIDLGVEKEINSVSVGCLQAVGSWVFYPQDVQVALFLDLPDESESIFSGTIENTISQRTPESQTHDFVIDCQGKIARYISINVRNINFCPDWHAGAGNPAWLFVDEIIVE